MDRPKWYLKRIKERTQRSWTEEEKLKIYTLRQKKVPPSVIARRFRATITQIYNITRMMNKAVNDKCFVCGKKFPIEEVKSPRKKAIRACESCKKKSIKYKRLRREKLNKKGLCGYCGRKKVVPGFKSCKDCISLTYRRRYIVNLCGRCGKHPIHKSSKTQCFTCKVKSRRASEANRQKEKATI